MCGIAGFTGRRHDPEALLGSMASSLTHRGPNEFGVHVTQTAGLASRRLSIIDVEGGHQPYESEDGAVVAVFNGEIYGFEELRRRLERKGHRFRSQADGEVIVHAYEEYSTEFLSELDGMFAIALWDERRERLVLARDRLGKKPLHVAHHADGTVTFASELQALLRDGKVGRGVNPEAIALFLQFGYVPAPWSAFDQVTKLSPGSALIWRPNGIEQFRYWQVSYEPKLAIGYEQAVEELDRRMAEAVQARLASEVPLGAFLSGGIDSSIVVAHMQELSATPVKTFAVGFSDPRYDERPHAAAVAKALGTEHHEEVVAVSDLTTVVPRLVRHYGEPYADSSMVPTYYLARMARAHVTVALNGDGGDELLGGYERHTAARWAGRFDCLPQPVRNVALAAARRTVRAGPDEKTLGHKLFRLVRSMEQPPAQRFADWSSTLTENERSRIAPRLMPTATLERRTLANDPLDAALAADLSHYLPDDLLTKVDIATMAVSLEARSPLLDHRLVEWTARLPVKYKQRGLRGKRLLRDALSRRLPSRLFERPKMGFAAPIGTWLRNDLSEMVTDLLLDDTARQRGYLNLKAVEDVVRAHRSGAVDHSRAIWTMLMLELWHREVIDGTTQPRGTACPA